MSINLSLMAKDDGLYCGDPVGAWVEDKHRLVALYETLFSTGMKRKWDVRVYVDLFAGPGIVRVRETGKFLFGSPFLALQVKDPFDKYIFCEKNPQSIEALTARVKKNFPNADVSFVSGDCNEKADEICSKIPVASQNFKVLSFCFVDPYDLSVKFSTISKIADRFVDFLMLLALYMDANRNLQHYLDSTNRKIDDFVGLADWRERWAAETFSGKPLFPQFLAETYSRQMETLDYLPLPFYRMKQIRSDVRNLPLYRLALFSRHELAYRYWDDVLKYSTSQMNFEI